MRQPLAQPIGTLDKSACSVYPLSPPEPFRQATGAVIAVHGRIANNKMQNNNFFNWQYVFV